MKNQIFFQWKNSSEKYLKIKIHVREWNVAMMFVSFDIRCELMFILVECNLFCHCRQFSFKYQNDWNKYTFIYNAMCLMLHWKRLKCQGAKLQTLCKRTSCVFCYGVWLHSFILFQWDYSFWLHGLSLPLVVFFFVHHRRYMLSSVRQLEPLFFLLWLFCLFFFHSPRNRCQ